MSKLLVIPDVHGRTFWKEAVEKEIENVDKVIFLGDYIDPYPYEGISPEEAIEVFKEILELKKENQDKVILLIGNHDWHYMSIDVIPCSRYDRFNSKEIRKYYKDNQDLFNLLYKSGKSLFSHAGVMREWLKEYCGCENIDELLGNEKKAYNNLWVVPMRRGGLEYFGSCIWNDIRDFSNELPGVFQIFGHTQLTDSLIEKDFACLDCRKVFVVDTEKEVIIETKYGAENIEEGCSVF